MYVIIQDNLPCVGLFESSRAASEWGYDNVRPGVDWRVVILETPGRDEDDAPTLPLVDVG